MTGPDGALWFTNSGNNSIGRIRTTGAVTFYTGSGISGPQDIPARPDGALWFTNVNDSIGRITTAGVVANYTGNGISPSFGLGIAAGSDGALWFANGLDNSIGRITALGAVTNYTGAMAVLDMRLGSACCRSSQRFRRLKGWCGPQATLRQE